VDFSILPAAGAGDHLITYTYTDPMTGCTNFCTFTITVIEVIVTCPEDFALCVDADPVILTGGLPEGGYYEGTGVTDGIFDPATAGTGLHVLTYTWIYPETNCSATCEFVVEVYPLPQMSCPEMMEACVDAPPVLLDMALPAGGIYSGTGVYFEDGNYYFDPTIGAGTYEINYCYADPVTGCEDCCTFDFVVNPLPVVTCPDDFITCFDTAPFELSGATPPGGSYTGTGVSGGLFDPTAAGAGDHLITYTYTDPMTGCTNFCTFTITVIEVM
jgi:hypothetical protein